MERIVAARGVEMRVSVALDTAERAVAITELRVANSSVRSPVLRTPQFVWDSRRLGLGAPVKAESLRLLAVERPDVTHVTTSNDETNTAMREINRRLGFLPVGYWTRVVVSLS